MCSLNRALGGRNFVVVLRMFLRTAVVRAHVVRYRAPPDHPRPRPPLRRRRRRRDRISQSNIIFDGSRNTPLTPLAVYYEGGGGGVSVWFQSEF